MAETSIPPSPAALGAELESKFAKQLDELKPRPDAAVGLRESTAKLSQKLPLRRDRTGGSDKTIPQALERLSAKYVAELRKRGIDDSVAALMKSWLEVTFEVARFESLKLAISAGLVATPPARTSGEDASKSMTAQELATALGVSDETVRQREKAGELFSILRPGRKRGREYPAFQSWPGIAGHPLKDVLAALKAEDNSVAYGFFTSTTDLLAGLTPIEVLTGKQTSPRSLDAAANSLLTKSLKERLAIVRKAAATHAASA